MFEAWLFREGVKNIQRGGGSFLGDVMTISTIFTGDQTIFGNFRGSREKFWIFSKKFHFWISFKTPKIVLLISRNKKSLRGQFVFKTNGKISSITSHFCSFFTSWVINQQKNCILNTLKKHPTFGVRCAPKIAPKPWNIVWDNFPS